MQRYFQRWSLVVVVVVIGVLFLWNLDVQAGAITANSIPSTINDLSLPQINNMAVLTTPVPSGPQIVVTPESLQAEHETPATVSTQTLTIQNPGDSSLSWSIYEDAPTAISGDGQIGYSMVEQSGGWYVLAFSLSNPSDYTIVGHSESRLVGLDFINNDFNTLYGVDEGARALVAYDLITLAEPRVIHFPAGAERLLGNAWDQSTGTYYFLGTTVSNLCEPPRQAVLYALDMATEVLTPLVVLQTDHCITEIAVSPDGVVYASDTTDDELKIVNTETGELTSVGPFEFGYYVDGMTIDFNDATGELYLMSNRLFTINLDTGHATYIGDAFRYALAITGSYPECDGATNAAWLSLSDTIGSTAPLGESDITVTFDSTELEVGTYTATLCIESNAAENPLISVPVSLYVGETSPPPTATPTETPLPTHTPTATPEPTYPEIEVTPESLQVEHPAADSVTTETLTIQNVGTAPLSWNIYESDAIALGGDGDYGYSMVEYDGWYVVRFSLTNPTSSTIVGPSLSRLVGLDFINNDLDTLYGVDEGARALVAYDLNTLEEPRVIHFPAGAERLLGNAWDQSTGTYYFLGTTVTNSCYPPRQATLYTLDMDTEVLIPLVTLQTDHCITDIAVSPSGEIYASDSTGDLLVKVNKVTGVLTTVGPFDFGYDTDGMTIDFDDETGELYLMNSDLFMIDVDTGQSTFVGGAYRYALAVAKPYPTCDEPTDASWLSVGTVNGTTDPQEESEVTVTFDSTGLEAGVYTTNLCIESNAINRPLVSVPVSLYVEVEAPTPTPTSTASPTRTPTATPLPPTPTPTHTPLPLRPKIEVIPESLDETHALPDTVTTETLTIHNPGTGLLTWALYENTIMALGGDGQIGYSMVEAGDGWYVLSFSLSNPSDYTIVGHSASRLVGLDFINNDFTTLYGVDEGLRALVAYDLNTLEEPRVIHFPAGAERLLGNAWDQSTGTYYFLGTTVTNGCYPPRQATLYTLDMDTEVLTPLVALQTDHCITDIAVSPSGEIYASDSTGDLLVKINKTTGALTTVGPFDFGYDTDGMTIDFNDSTGELYLMNSDLFTIDLSTAHATYVGPAFRYALAVAAPYPVCDNPSDISWLSVSDTLGETLPGASSTLDITFDSTGLERGTYHATICIASNAFGRPLVQVPITLSVDKPPVTPTRTPTAPAPTETPFPTSTPIATPAGGAGSGIPSSGEIYRLYLPLVK